MFNRLTKISGTALLVFVMLFGAAYKGAFGSGIRNEVTLFTANAWTAVQTFKSGLISTTYNTNIFICDDSTIPSIYANYKACVDIANVVSGNAAAVLAIVPDTYSVPATVIHGVNRTSGTGASTKMVAIWNVGVKFSCDMQDYSDCMEFTDAGGETGQGKLQPLSALALTTGPMLYVPSTSKIANIIAPAAANGAIQGSYFLDGLYILVQGDVIGCAVNTTGMQSGTTIRNIHITAPSSSTFNHRWAEVCATNPSKKTMTPDTVSGSGTVVTVTCSTNCGVTTTFPLMQARVWKGQWVAFSACSIGGFNGVFQVQSLDQTGLIFTYNSAQVGNPTSCTYKVVAPTGSFASPGTFSITTVHIYENLVLNCSGQTNCQPALFSTTDQASGASLGDIELIDFDPEAGDPVLPANVEIDGYGLGSGFASGPLGIRWFGGHSEASGLVGASGSCGIAIKVRDASSITIEGVSFTGCGAVAASGGTGTAVDVSQSAASRTSSVRLLNLSNLNYPTDYNNSITSKSRTLSASTGTPDSFDYIFGGGNNNFDQGQFVLDTRKVSLDENGTLTIVTANPLEIGLKQMPTAGTPTVVATCVPGVCNLTWGYKIVAKDGTGTGIAGTQGTTVLQNANIDTSNFNTVTWSITNTPKAVSYDVYRTAVAAGNTQCNGGAACNNNALVCTVAQGSALSCVDNGTVNPGSTTVPATNSSGNLKFADGKGQHILTQAAANDISGSCTFAGTTCTVTFTTPYNNAPVCTANDQTAAAPIRANPSTTTVVLTGGTGAGATDVVSYLCFGNPN